jgi:ribosomal protein S12 methylthiotransferase
MKVGFVSLGCPKNLVDGEVMLGLAREAGHEITADAQAANVIVVNTCAFIDRAKEESVEAILEMARLKRTGSCQRLVVTGCLAERYRDELQREIPEIDACLGTGDVPDIVGALHGSSEPGRSGVPMTWFKSRDLPTREARGLGHLSASIAQAEPRALPTYLYDAETPRLRTTPSHYAYVKVAEGCDYTCAFCIIPTLRGQYRSREADSIVREAHGLAASGVRELLLISQDTTFFGIDRHERGALARLLHRLNEVDGLEWVRLLYLYPTTITDDVLDAMAECEKVCQYVDLPLQHASAAVLRRMRRPGHRAAYDVLLAKIRRRVPAVTLRTTFIVGFPGETEQDFDELCAFVRETGFDHVGVFTYSHEEGTRAFALADDIPAKTKQSRRHRLMSLQKQIVTRRQKARLGETVRVMIDGASPDSPFVLQGRLQGQAPNIDPVVYLDQCDPSTMAPGSVISATVTGARGYDLIGVPSQTPHGYCGPHLGHP